MKPGNVATVAEDRTVATGEFDGDDLSVPDLRVGEIRALRKFRVSESGYLNPVVVYAAAGPWQDGPNTARCLGHGHMPAKPGCECGLYAYGTYYAACDYAGPRQLLAVVACWGRVVPGTRGLRAQYARIEAIWLSAMVPCRLVRLLREHYPSVTFYRSRRRMLRRHPPTRLDSYRPEPRRRRGEPVPFAGYRPAGPRPDPGLARKLLENFLILAGAGLVLLGMVLIGRAL